MKTKYISLFFSFVIAFGMMSCSSEIPNGDTSKFSDLKSPEERLFAIEASLYASYTGRY